MSRFLQIESQMNRQTKYQHKNSPSEHISNSNWLWTLSGLALGGLALLLYYLSNPNWLQVSTNLTSNSMQEQKSLNQNLTLHGGPISAKPLESFLSTHVKEPLNVEDEPLKSKPRFTFYQDLTEPQPQTIEPPQQVNTVQDIYPPNDGINITQHNEDDQHQNTIIPTSTQMITASPIQLTKKKIDDRHLKSNSLVTNAADNKNRSTTTQLTRSESGPTAQKNATLFVLQAGSFKDQIQADKHRAQLLLQGFDASVRAATLSNGEEWHRVILGPFKRSEAELLQARLKSELVETQLRKSQ